MTDELQVVHKNALHAPAADCKACAAADVQHGETAAVINVHGLGGKLASTRHDPALARGIKESVANDLDVGLRAGKDDAGAQFVRGHLQAEIQNRHSAAGHVLSHVQHEGAFAHRGTPSDDRELSWAETAGHVVESLKAGLNAELLARSHEFLQLVQHLWHNRAGRTHAVGAGAKGERQDRLAGVLQDIVGGLRHVAGRGLHVLRGKENAAARVEIAQGLDVVLNRGGSAGRLGEHLGDGA